MGKTNLKNTNDKFFSKSSKSFPRVEEEFRVIEEGEDLSQLQRIAAEGTSKGFKRAKKVSSNIIIV